MGTVPHGIWATVGGEVGFGDVWVFHIESHLCGQALWHSKCQGQYPNDHDGDDGASEAGHRVGAERVTDSYVAFDGECGDSENRDVSGQFADDVA